MDNACHTLCALALARLGLDRLAGRATTALVLAANLPDADTVSALLGGKPGYLIFHRGITHSLAGLLLQAVLVAALLSRWPRRDPAAPRPRFAGLLLAAAAGAGSHLGLDALNSYGIRPWLPFHDRWLYFDVAFVIDPFLWTAFGVAAVLGGRSNRGGDLAWLLWTAAATTLLVLAGGRFAVPWPAPATLAVGMALALLVRRGRLPGPRRRTGAAAGLALALAYLAALLLLGQLAGERARAALAAAGLAPGQVEASSRMPRPAQPLVFEVMVATADATQPVTVDLWHGTAHIGRALPRGLDPALLERLRLTQEFRAWRVFARLPVVRPGAGDGAVRLGDARFEAFGRDDWSALEVVPPR